MRLAAPARLSAHPTLALVAIADTGNDRVVIAGLDGCVLGVIEDVARPYGVRFTTNGAIVCEAARARVVHVGLDYVAPSGRLLVDSGPRTVVIDGLAAPTDCVLEADGTVLVANPAGPTIVAVDANGDTTVVAGSPGRAAHVDGPPRASRTVGPVGLAAAPQGTFVVDRDAHALRILSPTRLLATLIGRGPAHPGFADGPVATASFQHPSGVVAAPDGASAYIADTGNDALRLWSGVDGEVMTVPLPLGALAAPSDLDLLPDGRLIVADTGHDRVVIVDLRRGAVETLVLEDSR